MPDPLADLSLPQRLHAPARTLATAIIERVLDGRASPGDAMPSPRPLAAQLLISIAVIEDAYDDVVRLGILTEDHRVSPQARTAAMRWARAEVRAGLRATCRRAEELGIDPDGVRAILADIQQFEVVDG